MLSFWWKFRLRSCQNMKRKLSLKWNIPVEGIWVKSTCHKEQQDPTKPWWRHQMETFSTLLAICAGNSPTPTQRPVFSLICIRINGWVNNGDAGDLRRHRPHYDVILMADTVHNSWHILRAPFTNIVWFESPHGWVIEIIMTCIMKLLVNS